jgi:hypothetical protein
MYVFKMGFGWDSSEFSEYLINLLTPNSSHPFTQSSIYNGKFMQSYNACGFNRTFEHILL